ncbi:hypothetical protein CAEBREN_17869 [Caenorhabditis brenneri]|uniref:Sdz-33 F-box domain-containing protein n=1 Tax=Caenorhabditis brenneri TaxID=135651 RepID=G0PC44_CAEBE|nr:hypothetical protein CAEBREN_17869 [Caenorhabditis brenneri]
MLPFFKFPLFPLLYFIQMWSLKEIINFSMVSKHSFYAVRFLLRYLSYCKPITVTMDIYENHHEITVFSDSEKCVVRVMNKKELEDAQSSQQTFNGIQYLFVDKNEIVNTYWKDEDLALKMIYAHVRDLFGKPIDYLTYIPSKDNLHVDFLEAISNDQQNVENCSIGAMFGLSGKDVGSILNILQNTRNLNLSYTVLDYDLSGYKFHNLVIEDGERFPCQKLVKLDFESLDLYQLYDFDECLKKEELNTFLRLWITGNLPRMKNFRLETVLSLPFPDVLKTINFEPSGKLLDIDEENTVLTGGPYNIRRLTDGKIATVYTLDYWNENGQQMTYFEFSVDE